MPGSLTHQDHFLGRNTYSQTFTYLPAFTYAPAFIYVPGSFTHQHSPACITYSPGSLTYQLSLAYQHSLAYAPGSLTRQYSLMCQHSLARQHSLNHQARFLSGIHFLCARITFTDDDVTTLLQERSPASTVVVKRREVTFVLSDLQLFALQVRVVYDDNQSLLLYFNKRNSFHPPFI